MVFRKAYARWVTNISFILALILTVFLLSGTTSTTPGVRNLYVAKIELNSTRVETLTSLPTPSTVANQQAAKTSTPAHQTSTAIITIKSTIMVSTAKPLTSSTSGSSKISTHAASTTSRPSSKKRNAPEEDKHVIYNERTALGTEKTRAKYDLHNDVVILPRQLKPETRALFASDANGDEGSIVLISYFGVCVSNTTTDWSCTKKRNQAQTLEGAPMTFLELCGSLQGAISPLPPIIAVVLQGTLVILSCLLGCRSSTGLQTKLGKIFVVLAFAAFSASTFTAILFQSAAGLIYGAFITSDTIDVSKGSGGIALAWAGVFFTGLAMAGVITLVLFADVPENLKSRAKEPSLVSRFFNTGGRHERDIEIPPVHLNLQKEVYRPVVNERRELHPEKGNFKPETPGQKAYSERVENMRRGNTPFGNGWNMI